MPGTFEAAAVFTLLVAPGFLMVRGYARLRNTVPPDRDLYALGQAVVASVVWLATLWLVLALVAGDPLKEWGILPLDEGILNHNRLQVVGIFLAFILLPYPIGAGGALAASYTATKVAKEEPAPLWALIAKIGLFKPATAWDRAWLKFRLAGGVVDVRLKDGSMIRGTFGENSQADTSPAPHQLFLESGFGLVKTADPDDADDDEGQEDGGEEEVLLEAQGPKGIFIEGTEVAAVYFLPEAESEEAR